MALHGLITKWRADTDEMVAGLTEHAGALRSAGLAYRDTDAGAAEKTNEAGARLDGPGSEL